MNSVDCTNSSNTGMYVSATPMLSEMSRVAVFYLSVNIFRGITVKNSVFVSKFKLSLTDNCFLSMVNSWPSSES